MLKNIITLIILLLLVDSIWLYLIKDKYANQVEIIQKESMKINYYSALVTYILIAIGLFYITDLNPSKAFLFGVVGYGIYDFTNGAIFKDWDFNIAVADTLWGGVLSAVTVYLHNKIL